MNHRSISCVAILLLLGAVPRSARAEASAADEAVARALFKEGRSLIDSEPARACPKFEESQRLDPGIGTLLNLGICYEAIGKTASAYGAFGEAAVMAHKAGDKPRQDDAERRAKAVEAKLSRL